MTKTTEKKTTEKKSETLGAAETIKENVQDSVKNSMDSYLNTVASSSDRLAADFGKARERNARIMDSFLQTMENGRKDMLELSRVVASAPTDYKANMQATIETMTRRQECALSFGKTLYREQSEMTGEVSERAKEMFAPLNNANLDLMAPYKSMTKFWSAAAK
jgi:hypothetical protein